MMQLCLPLLWLLVFVPAGNLGPSCSEVTTEIQDVYSRVMFANKSDINITNLSSAPFPTSGMLGCVSNCFAESDCSSVFYDGDEKMCMFIKSEDNDVIAGVPFAHSTSAGFVKYAEVRLCTSSTTTSTTTSTTSTTTSTTSTTISTSSTITSTTTMPPTDCTELLASGFSLDGVYQVNINGSEVNIFCDMTTDGGGWTVFQQRLDGAVEFYRNWAEYVNGFGNVASTGSFWLGLELIHQMTSIHLTELYIEMTPPDDTLLFARYSAFSLKDAETDYVISVFNYSGNAGDSMTYHSGKKFSTSDKDNSVTQGCSEACATRYGGSWWYDCCYRSNLNGKYSDADGSKTIKWSDSANYGSQSMKYTKMMFRRSADATVPQEPACINTSPAYSDCKQLKEDGNFTTTGLYCLKPDGMTEFRVVCDMTTDGGGWTVFQQRLDGAVGFWRGWVGYVDGFGVVLPLGSYWLGLEKIWNMTSGHTNELYIEVTPSSGAPELHAKYSSFNLGSSETNYAISVSGHIGNDGDIMSIHDGRQFSAFEHTLCSCLNGFTGSWWFDCAGCAGSNLNGMYWDGAMKWAGTVSLERTQMMFRRLY